jgi:hypothetical protein
MGTCSLIRTAGVAISIFRRHGLRSGRACSYVLLGFLAGHFRRNLFPAASDLSIKELGGSLVRHLRQQSCDTCLTTPTATICGLIAGLGRVYKGRALGAFFPPRGGMPSHVLLAPGSSSAIYQPNVCVCT